MLTRSGRPFAGRGAVPSAAKLGPADGESRHARTADPGPAPGKVQADSTQISTLAPNVNDGVTGGAPADTSIAAAAETIPLFSSRPPSVVFSTASSASVDRAQRDRAISPVPGSRQSSHVVSGHRSRQTVASHVSGPVIPPDVNALLHKFTDNLNDTLRYERERADLELRRESQRAAETLAVVSQLHKERADFERDREQAHAAEKIKILQRQNEQQQTLFDRMLAVEKERVTEVNERQNSAIEAERFRASEQLQFQEELHAVRLQLADKDKQIAKLSVSERNVVSGSYSLQNSLSNEFCSQYMPVTMSVPLYSSFTAAASAQPVLQPSQLSPPDFTRLAAYDAYTSVTSPLPPFISPADQYCAAPALSTTAPPCSDADLISDWYYSSASALGKPASTQLTSVYTTPLVQPSASHTFTASVYSAPLSGCHSQSVSSLPPSASLQQSVTMPGTTPAPGTSAYCGHALTPPTGPAVTATAPSARHVASLAASTHAPLPTAAIPTATAVSFVTPTCTAQSVTQSAAPPIVIKQQQRLKPYNGTSSWKSFREHFGRVAAINNWTTDAEKVQHLSVGLEGSAAEILKDIDETAPSALHDIWQALSRRFGAYDEPRELMRRFDSRRQDETESVSEYETALRVLHRDAWPTMPADQRDFALKRKFEDSVFNSDLQTFLRLHARDLDFTATVLKARHFLEASNIKTKKTVRILNHSSVSDSDATWQPLLDGFQRMLTATLGQNKRAGTPPLSGNSSPVQRSQSPAARTNYQPLAGADHALPGRNRVQSPRPAAHLGHATAMPPAVHNRPGFVPTMQQQPQTYAPRMPQFRTRIPQQQQSFVANSPHAPRRFTQPYQAAYSPRAPYAPRPPRRPTGCHVCGQIGCHSDFHFAGPPLPQQQSHVVPHAALQMPYTDGSALPPPPEQFAEQPMAEPAAYQQPAHSNTTRGPRPVQAPIMTARPASR